MHDHAVRLELERPAIARGGVAQPVLVGPDVAEGDLGLGAVRIEVQGSPAAGFGLAQQALLAQAVSQAGVGDRQAGVVAQSLAEARQRGLDPAALPQQQTEVAMRLGVVRAQRQRPPVGMIGVLEPAQARQRVAPVEVRRRVAGIEADGALMGGQRGAGLPLPVAGDALVVVRFDVVRPERKGMTERRDRLLEVAAADEREPQVVMSARVAPIQQQRLLVGRDRLVRPAEIQIQIAEVDVGRRQVRVRGDRPAIAFERRGGLALLPQRVAQIIVRERKARIGGDRLAVASDRGIGPPLARPQPAEIVVRGGQARLQGERAQQGSFGARKIAAFARDHRQQIERFDVVRAAPEDPRQDRPGLGQLAGPNVPQRVGQSRWPGRGPPRVRRRARSDLGACAHDLLRPPPARPPPGIHDPACRRAQT